MKEGSVPAKWIITIALHKSPKGDFLFIKENMSKINKLFVKYAVYQVETKKGHVVALVNYAENSYELVGLEDPDAKRVVEMMLANKHGVNFAYKFNDKIGE